MMFSKSFFTIAIFIFVSNTIFAQNAPLFRSAKAPVQARVNDILRALTLPEKISLLGNNSPAVERLHIPSYNWWSESLHGLARAGEATIFPQAIGMAATFNDSLLLSVASAISTDAST